VYKQEYIAKAGRGNRGVSRYSAGRIEGSEVRLISYA